MKDFTGVCVAGWALCLLGVPALMVAEKYGDASPWTFGAVIGFFGAIIAFFIGCGFYLRRLEGRQSP